MLVYRTELDDGFIRFEKETVGDELRLIFTARLPIAFPVEDIWEQLELAFLDSERSWFWSGQAGQSVAQDKPLRTDARIRTTYTFPSEKDPSAPPVKSTYTYEMRRWEPDAHVLQYHTGEDHPFKGGATVSLEAISDNSTRLHWDGLYLMESGMDAIADHFGKYFSQSMQGFLDARPGES